VKLKPILLYSPGKDFRVLIRDGVGPRVGLEASKERKLVSPVVKSHYGGRNCQFKISISGVKKE